VTKLITILIIVVAIYFGYHLYLYWGKFNHEKETSRKEAATVEVQPEGLSGLPQTLEQSLRAAQQQVPAAMKSWLKTNGNQVQDPRRAWIELDYCEAVYRADPSEARRVFASVKQRTPPSSPAWPRVKQLEKSYE
jgi:hypothetical protein